MGRRSTKLVRIRNRARRAREFFGIEFGPGEEKSVFGSNLRRWDRNWKRKAHDLGFEVT